MVISCDFLGVVLWGLDQSFGGDTWGCGMILPNMDMHQVLRIQTSPKMPHVEYKSRDFRGLTTVYFFTIPTLPNMFLYIPSNKMICG